MDNAYNAYNEGSIMNPRTETRLWMTSLIVLIVAAVFMLGMWD